eukprot:scaffold1796_cov60-Cyclotella_meneghiniana.AAC.13
MSRGPFLHQPPALWPLASQTVTQDLRSFFGLFCARARWATSRTTDQRMGLLYTQVQSGSINRTYLKEANSPQTEKNRSQEIPGRFKTALSCRTSHAIQ